MTVWEEACQGAAILSPCLYSYGTVDWYIKNNCNFLSREWNFFFTQCSSRSVSDACDILLYRKLTRNCVLLCYAFNVGVTSDFGWYVVNQSAQSTSICTAQITAEGILNVLQGSIFTLLFPWASTCTASKRKLASLRLSSRSCKYC